MSLDLAMCDAIRNSLLDAFPTTYIGLPHDNDRITMPCIILDLKGNSLVNSPLWTGQLSVMVAQQADDSTVAQHIEFVKEVSGFLTNLEIDSDAVQLYGIVSKTSDGNNSERHWSTTLTSTIGYGPKL
jgi:hypothetical protein